MYTHIKSLSRSSNEALQEAICALDLTDDEQCEILFAAHKRAADKGDTMVYVGTMNATIGEVVERREAARTASREKRAKSIAAGLAVVLTNAMRPYGGEFFDRDGREHRMGQAYTGEKDGTAVIDVGDFTFDVTITMREG